MGPASAKNVGATAAAGGASISGNSVRLIDPHKLGPRFFVGKKKYCLRLE
jgi:hypothetical protein